MVWEKEIYNTSLHLSIAAAHLHKTWTLVSSSSLQSVEKNWTLVSRSCKDVLQLWTDEGSTLDFLVSVNVSYNRNTEDHSRQSKINNDLMCWQKTCTPHKLLNSQPSSNETSVQLQKIVYIFKQDSCTVKTYGSFDVKSTNFAKVPQVNISDLLCYWSMQTPILVKYTCKISAPNVHPLVIYAHFSERGVVKNCSRSQFSCIFTLSYLKMYDA